MSFAPQLDSPVFTTPVRWLLRVLSWLAFAVSVYLAWHAVNLTPVLGCSVGDSGCDLVLGSMWSKWLGVPVAVPGLACYATLATLSVLLGWSNARAARWINTAFLLLAVAAAGASLWFLALQVFVIGHFCPYCIVTDLCGIALGGVAIWSAARWLHATRYLRRMRASTPALMALRTALPMKMQGAQPAAASRTQAAPSLAVSLGGAGALLLLLIGGQILFPAKSYEVQQVALDENIEMNGGNEPAEPKPPDAEKRVAMRIPTDSVQENEAAESDNESDAGVVAAGYDAPGSGATTDEADSSPAASDARTEANRGEVSGDESLDEPPPSAPARQRLVKFLNGKLTLDVYKHPLIGSPEAPHVMVEMVSYNCKHCRATHSTVKKALARYGNQVAMIIMVIPQERGCNRLVTSAAASQRGACLTARMSLSVATLKPTSFAKFHEWLMSGGDYPPPSDQIVARAYSLVDRERLRELSSGDRIKKQIEGYVNLYATLGKQNASNKQFGLPVQILGDYVMTGSVEKPSDLYQAWEEHLGVKR